MRAVVLTPERPTLALAEVEDPRPEPGEAVLRVTSCGICGSDLHIAARIGEAGAILGHEIAGEIVGLGGDVDAGRWTVGAQVAARPLSGCGRCPWCDAGRSDHCERFALVGLHRP